MRLLFAVSKTLIDYLRNTQDNFVSRKNKTVFALLGNLIASVRGSSLIALFLMFASIRVAGAATVTLSPHANIQAAVNSHPAGTTFSLNAGIYRMQSVVPLQGDKFIGHAGADLNGSKVVTNWQRNGIYWVSSGNLALNTRAPAPYSCQSPASACTYPQDLYLNNRPLEHQRSLPIVSGQWYFDYRTDLVYMADNPSGHMVELSVTKSAFRGPADNVTLQGLIVEKYAAPIANAAIQPNGSGWIIRNNEVRLNHGEGIKTHGNNEHVLSNNVHDNGQEGACAGGGDSDVFEFNKVSGNNFAKIHYGIEMGGGKYSSTTNAQIINNVFSDNDGNGIWIDALATGSIVQGNTVTNNHKDGIRCEDSHYCMISNNTLTNNAENPATGVCIPNAREITISASDHSTVTGNTITSNCAGIWMGGYQRNEYIDAVDDIVTDNSMTYSRSVPISSSIGAADGTLGASSPLFNPANNNYFDYNTYHLNSRGMLSIQIWVWGGKASSTKDWSQWRAAGQDIHGTAD